MSENHHCTAQELRGLLKDLSDDADLVVTLPSGELGDELSQIGVDGIAAALPAELKAQIRIGLRYLLDEYNVSGATLDFYVDETEARCRAFSRQFMKSQWDAEIWKVYSGGIPTEFECSVEQAWWASLIEVGKTAIDVIIQLAALGIRLELDNQRLTERLRVEGNEDRTVTQAVKAGCA